MQAFGEGAEGGERLGDLGLRFDREGLHIVVLVLHLLVLEEGRVLDFRHSDGIKKMGVGRDVHRLDVREGGEHHQHLRRLEHLGVVLHVAVVHLDVRLREEAEDLGEEVALRLGEVALPVLHVIGQRHFLGQPVDALLGQPGIIGPGVAEGLVDRIRGEKVELHRQFVGCDAIGHLGHPPHAAVPPYLPELVVRAIGRRNIW